MKLRYFAWVRERAGLAEEDVTVPENIKTVGELIGWLKSRGAQFEHAFENQDTIQAAIDQSRVEHTALVGGAREIAFFPPVTGG